jgi:hypothetical protein
MTQRNTSIPPAKGSTSVGGARRYLENECYVALHVCELLGLHNDAILGEGLQRLLHGQRHALLHGKRPARGTASANANSVPPSASAAWQRACAERQVQPRTFIPVSACCMVSAAPRPSACLTACTNGKCKCEHAPSTKKSSIQRQCSSKHLQLTPRTARSFRSTDPAIRALMAS